MLDISDPRELFDQEMEQEARDAIYAELEDQEDGNPEDCGE